MSSGSAARAKAKAWQRLRAKLVDLRSAVPPAQLEPLAQLIDVTIQEEAHALGAARLKLARAERRCGECYSDEPLRSIGADALDFCPDCRTVEGNVIELESEE